MSNPYGWGQNEPQIKPKDQGGDTIATFSQKVYNLFDALFNTLNSYPWSTATQSDAGYMSAEDKAALDDVPNTYLPLSGGAMTGDISHGTTDGFLRVYGGSGSTTGARLALAPSGLSGFEGEFWLVARSSSSGDVVLKGRPNGELIWNNKYVPIVDSVDTTNSGYIRLTNGLQFLWGNVNVNSTSGIAVTFERAFTSIPRIFTNIAFSAANGHGYEGQAVGRTTTGFSAYIGSSQNGTSTAFATGSLNYFAVGPWL